MLKIIFNGLLVMLTLSTFSQDVQGIWETIDEETGKATSHILIFEVKGKTYGKVIKIIDPKDQESVCSACANNDPRKDEKILGIILITNLKKEGKEYNGGEILDPNNGKVYSCKLWLDEKNSNKLNVRGFIGLSILGRSQIWNRVK